MHWHLKAFYKNKKTKKKKQNKTKQNKKTTEKRTGKSHKKSSKVTYSLLPFVINQFSHCHKCLKIKLF